MPLDGFVSVLRHSTVRYRWHRAGTLACVADSKRYRGSSLWQEAETHAGYPRHYRTGMHGGPSPSTANSKWRWQPATKLTGGSVKSFSVEGVPGLVFKIQTRQRRANALTFKFEVRGRVKNKDLLQFGHFCWEIHLIAMSGSHWQVEILDLNWVSRWLGAENEHIFERASARPYCALTLCVSPPAINTETISVNWLD